MANQRTLSAPSGGPALSRRASSGASSAVRDLLAQAASPGMISLAGGLPDASLFPIAELSQLTARLIAEDGAELLQYGRTEGSDRSRRLLAAHFGLADPERVLITSGSQQGLDLIFQVLADPGDQVIVGDPEYVGLLQVLHSHGVEPVPIRSDADGMDVDDLARRLRAGLRPKACYLVPHFHNPSGATISTERRVELHRLSTEYGFVVVEDDPYRDLYHPDGPPPTDIEADPDWTIRLRTTSKSLAPGLRVAVVEAPPAVHGAMVLAKQSADLHTSSLTQAVAAEAVGQPWFVGHVDRLRRRYAAKSTVLADALEASFGPLFRSASPQLPGSRGGMFLWVDFGSVSSLAGVDCDRWLNRALAEGVCFVPGSAFAVEADLRTCARFSFATASDAELVEGVERLTRSVRY